MGQKMFCNWQNQPPTPLFSTARVPSPLPPPRPREGRRRRLGLTIEAQHGGPDRPKRFRNSVIAATIGAPLRSQSSERKAAGLVARKASTDGWRGSLRPLAAGRSQGARRQSTRPSWVRTAKRGAAWRHGGVVPRPSAPPSADRAPRCEAEPHGRASVRRGMEEAPRSTSSTRFPAAPVVGQGWSEPCQSDIARPRCAYAARFVTARGEQEDTDPKEDTRGGRA